MFVSNIGEHHSRDSCMKKICKVLDETTAEDIKSLGVLLRSKALPGVNISTEYPERARDQIMKWSIEWKWEFDRAYVGSVGSCNAMDTQAAHRDFNNELVDSGFYEFAFALMILEQHVVPSGIQK